MTGPYRGGTGGAGWGGAFSAMGDATENYFDKLNTYNQQAEQRRQFDAQLEQNKSQLAMQQKQLQIQQYDRFDKGIGTLREYYEQNSKYMTPETNKVFGEMLQHGDAASMAFWASDDESGLEGHAQKYGPGKAWGADVAGNPINMDTITAEVNKNKPIKDMEDKMRGSYGDTVANMLSTALLDPNSPARELAGQYASGNFNGKPEELFAAAFATSTQGPKMLLSGLAKNNFTAESYAYAEDVLKLLPESAYTITDEKGNKTIDPSYETLTRMIEQNRGRIDEFRQARDIGAGKGTILAYDTSKLALDKGAWDFSRAQVAAGKADVRDIGNLINEGDYATLSQPAGKAEYAKVYRIGQPNATDEQIEAAYQIDLGRARTTDDQRRSIAASQVTITNNQALQSNMDTEQKQILFDALKPYIGEDAVAQRNFQALVTANGTTEAQFTAAVLPTMLKLKNSAEKSQLLQTLASAPGGMGRSAIRAALDAKMISQEEFDSLDGYAGQIQTLWKKGVNVQGMQLSADYMTAALSKQLSDAYIKAGMPRTEAEAKVGTLRAQGEQALVQELYAQGQQPNAMMMGRSATGVQLSNDNLTRLNNRLQTNMVNATIPYSALMGSTAARAQIQSGLTTIAQNMVQRYIAEGGLPLARQVGASGMQTQLSNDAMARINNDVQSAIRSGQLPLAAQIGEAQAREMLQTAVTTTMQQFYNGEVLEGQTPYAFLTGTMTGQANVAEQSLRLQTINSTIDLLPAQSAAQRQSYATAIANGQFDEALATLKKNNVDFDYAITQAGAMQSLAGLDPKASLASSIKNPQVRAMYQNAVRLSNEQRDLANQLAQVKNDKTGKGSDITTQINSLNGTISNFRQQVKAVYTTPEVTAALDKLTKTQGVTVAADAVTGLYKIVVASTDPTVRQQALAASQVINAATEKAKPLAAQITTLNGQVLNLTRQLGTGAVGQPNGGTSTPAPVGTGSLRGKAIDNIGSGDMSGLNSQAVNNGRNGKGQVVSYCTTFARSTSELERGLKPGQLGSGGAGYFQATATATMNAFRNKNAMYANNMTKPQALAQLKNVKKGDLLFLDYGDPGVDHVAVADGKGGIIQQSSPRFRGTAVTGDVNRMSLEDFVNKSGAVRGISFGRLPEAGGDVAARPGTGQSTTPPAFNNTGAVRALPSLGTLPNAAELRAAAVQQAPRIAAITDVPARKQEAYNFALALFNKTYPNFKDAAKKQATVALIASQMYNWVTP